jgi:serine/threonine protein kinase
MRAKSSPLQTGDPTSFGGWKLKGRLGEGGSSLIYLGEKNGVLAALKMIKSSMIGHGDILERFATEIRNLKALDHPNIAKFIEADIQTEVPYLAVEYIEGQNLDQLITEQGPLDLSTWLKMFTEICSALNYCHSRSVFHKDVSPKNIVIGKNGAILIDFGLSYEQGTERLTQLEIAVGTPEFMSPEHWIGPLRAEMDIFSLGSTFVFAGTGNLAFSAETKRQWDFSIRNLAPNLVGLSDFQKDLVTPLLFKLPDERPKLDVVLKALQELKSGTKYSAYQEYLEGSESKLGVVEKIRTSGISPLKKVGVGVIVGVLATSIVIFGLSSQTSNLNSEQAGEVLPSVAASSTTNPSPSAAVTASPKASATKVTIAQVSPQVIKPTPVVLQPSSKPTVNSSSDSSNCASTYKTGSYEDAIKQCAKEVAAGSVEAQYFLGVSYRLTRDEVNARKVFQACAQKGNLECVNEFAYYQFREGDKSLARGNWMKAFDGGVIEAGRALGVSYKTDANYSQAISWLDKAASKGDKDAAIYAVEIYQYELKELDQALTYARKYEAAGISGMKERIGTILYVQKKYSEAKLALLPCAEKDYIPCMSVLALVYYDEKDVINSKKWASKSAAKDQVAAINLMARISLYLEYDLATAKVWYQKSASKGDLEGMHSLGSSFALLDNDIKMACFWWGQTFLKGEAQQKAGTDTETTQKWIDAASEQYDKRDCKNK